MKEEPLMRKRTWIVAAVAAGLGLAQAHGALAQCAVVGVKKSSQQKINLNRKYAGCTAPDVTTVDGIAACSAAAPVAGQWAAGADTTKASLRLKSGSSGDVSVTFKVSGVIEASDLATPADGTGTLRMTLHLTTDDPTEGLVTTVPFEVSAPVSVVKGKADLKTSLNTMLSALGLNPLGACWSAEVDGISFQEPGGLDFLTGTSPSFSEASHSCCATRG
jgi:hypothetical protein